MTHKIGRSRDTGGGRDGGGSGGGGRGDCCADQASREEDCGGFGALAAVAATGPRLLRRR